MHVIHYDEFLTTDSGGDIGIDDDFEDEIIIPVPDF